MVPVIGDENMEGEAMGCGHFRRGRGGGGEVAPRCRWRTTKERAAWRLEVKDDQRKLVQWAECPVGSNC
jgi:hypothetical protein